MLGTAGGDAKHTAAVPDGVTVPHGIARCPSSPLLGVHPKMKTHPEKLSREVHSTPFTAAKSGTNPVPSSR